MCLGVTCRHDIHVLSDAEYFACLVCGVGGGGGGVPADRLQVAAVSEHQEQEVIMRGGAGVID